MYLLDTSTLIDLVRNRRKPRARAAEVAARADVYASAISVGELMIGINHLRRARPDEYPAELRRVGELVDGLTAVLPVTIETAHEYGAIQAELRSRGAGGLTINDGWIAATAVQHDQILVTSDEHLKSLQGMGLLQAEDWRL
jgi:tRNA(fMet)-specific endonuclease VapC